MLFTLTPEEKPFIRNILKRHFHEKCNRITFDICGYWDVTIKRKNDGMYYVVYTTDDGCINNQNIGHSLNLVESFLLKEIDFAEWCKERNSIPDEGL